MSEHMKLASGLTLDRDDRGVFVSATYSPNDGIWIAPGDIHAVADFFAADRDALAAKLGEAERERDALKDEIEREHGLYAQIREAEQAANVAMHERDAAMADLAKAREELEALKAEYQCAECQAVTRERDEARSGSEAYSRLLATSEKALGETAAQLAALEARAADARMVCEWLTSDSDDKEPREAAFEAARRYLANAPAAPAKADDAWMSRALDGPEIRDDAHADAILAEAGIDPVKALAKTMEMVERYELAAQLAEAVEIIRELVDILDGDRDDIDGFTAQPARTFLAAIDAGRARAT